MDSDGLSEIEEKVDIGQGPGFKFFYSLTNSPSETVFPYPIESRFDTYMKGGTSGTGRYWTLESSQSAPGFFLFTPTSSSELNPLTVIQPDEDQIDTSSEMALVGTFAFSASADSLSGSFRYGSNMDISLDRSTGTIDLQLSGVDQNSDGNTWSCY